MCGACRRPVRRSGRRGELEHKPEVVEAWVSELCRRFGQGAIAVAVEQVKGALVFMLCKYECLHLYPVPSTMSSSMREALYPSGAKDDPRDADLLLDLLLQNRDKLRRLTPDNEATRRVQNLLQCEPWLSNGFASCFAAGKTVRRTTRTDIWRPWPSVARS